MSSVQVLDQITANIRAAGVGMEPAIGQGQLYAALLPSEPYPGVTAVRDLAYGSDPLQTLDVLAPETRPPGPVPVVMFVHGGGFVRGDKRIPGTPFHDHMLLWAVAHGMMGVNINYRLAPKDTWPAGAQDLAAAIAWTRANVARWGGDADRIFIWGHSAGGNHVADYVAHPEVRGPEFAGVQGAVLLSAFYGSNPTEPNAYYGSDFRLASLEASTEALAKAGVPIFIGNAEFDPPMFKGYAAALKAALEAAGRRPGHVYLKDHNHFSEGLAVGTPDESLTGPLLEWMQSLP